ncbi:Altered inheritance of mitochondria protein 24, mitochondrial [Saxophila tyrrhenica]|uniref:Altered inheritance of mitochondria protein 24, mitochondrial n=1 Tax=Saxophila tyrrhenica TaxID=1690608 RepID=A0AAV9P8B3_9PEZI|nr:Altered inheritance of mitochondria protein 24, mitochondrial [Saxophila tyrrhenica]
MRRRALDFVCASCRHCSQSQARIGISRTSRRYVQISATPTSTEPSQNLATKDASPSVDARFEVLGSPFSLLSASISASQNLYSRKGTLVGFNGNPENAVSTLSLLEPFRRAFFGIPFVYQRISSTTPYTALISTKSKCTSMVVVHLDGRLDWMIAQRNALLAWTGHTLSLAPRLNTKMSLAHWGNTLVSGRGLLALSGRGLIHQIHLKTGDEYVVHPGNVIAYSMMQNAPQPYRFKASSFRLQIPSLTGWLPDTRFWRTMRESAIWTFTRNAAFVSRGAGLSDVLTSRDVNEIADSPAGSLPKSSTVQSPAEAGISTQSASTAQPASMSYASVNREGTVNFDKEKQ